MTPLIIMGFFIGTLAVFTVWVSLSARQDETRDEMERMGKQLNMLHKEYYRERSEGNAPPMLPPPNTTDIREG